MKNKYLDKIAEKIIISLLCVNAITLFGILFANKFIVFSVGVILLAVIVLFCISILHKRNEQTKKVLKFYSNGYTVDGIYNIMFPYSKEMENAIDKFKKSGEASQLLESSKKHAEYLALQNQINPHFLYNTLESIRGEAITNKMDNIANMTEALATFFRYNISNVQNLVTLKEELNNVLSYYTIQKYRFGNKLCIDIDVAEEEIYSLKMPKLILQPIVENAIFHGIERKRDNGLIKISVEVTQNRIIITIKDNGVGISEEDVEKLNKKLLRSNEDFSKSKKGIALTNVNNRIKLMFGDNYGLYIYSSVNVGTDVKITLPKIYEG